MSEKSIPTSNFFSIILFKRVMHKNLTYIISSEITSAISNCSIFLSFVFNFHVIS